jgi:hypothetical protein
MNDVIEIKRTSLRFRNPKNAPDQYEREALKYFQTIYLKTGKVSEALIQKINKNSSTHFRFYKPLTMKSLCLNCHGRSENIAPNITYQIKKLYPEDYAQGYQVDDFRGLVRVSIK